MSVTVPSSDGGRRLSCWALLSRWISSMKRMVCAPPASSRARAAVDDLPDPGHALGHRAEGHEHPLRWRWRPGGRAWSSRCPAGPRRSSSRARRARWPRGAACPAPSRCSWPTNSSSVRGRMRAASGCAPRAVDANSDSSPWSGARFRGISEPSPRAAARRRRSQRPAEERHRGEPSALGLELRHQVGRRHVERDARGNREPVLRERRHAAR